jgi:hypothetical protein
LNDAICGTKWLPIITYIHPSAIDTYYNNYLECKTEIEVKVMVFYATFKNISVISYISVSFIVEETGVPGENK